MKNTQTYLKVPADLILEASMYRISRLCGLSMLQVLGRRLSLQVQVQVQVQVQGKNGGGVRTCSPQLSPKIRLALLILLAGWQITTLP